MALGTAPRRVSPGVWVTASGRKLTPAGSAYWENHYRTGRTDGQGHVTRPSVVQQRPAPPRQPSTPTVKPSAPAPKAPGVLTRFEASIGHDKGGKVAAYDRYERKHKQARRESAAQIDRLVSAQFGGVEQIAAKANKVVNPRVGAVLEALSPRTAVDQTASALRHHKFGAAGVAALGIVPFGPGKAAGLGKVVKAERAVAAADAGRRTLRVGEKVQQLPRARSKITQTLIENPADRFSQAHPKLPLAGAEARVAKHAGRETLMEGNRANAVMVRHGKALPKEGSASDTAHFWWAQLPKASRNVESLEAIRAKQAAELDKIASGKELERLRKRNAKLQIAGLPKRAEDLSASIALLDRAIKAAPKVEPKSIAAVHAFSGDRQAVLQHVGLLNPERAAARKGIVSNWLGAKPTGEEAFIGHRLDRVRGVQEALVPASAGTGKARIPEGVSKQNKLVRARLGQVRMSTHVAKEDWQAAQTYRQAVRAREDLGKMGRPFTGHVDWKTERLVNPKGRTIPKEWKTDPLAKLAEQGHDDEQVRRAAEQILAGYLAKNKAEGEALAHAAMEHGVDLSDLRVVPKRMVDRYYGQFVKPPKGSALGGVYDSAVDFSAASIIFARLGYIPKNVAQNLVMAAPHQGPYLLANLPRAAQVVKDRELYPLLAGEVGGSGPTAALGQEFVHKVKGIPGKIAQAVSSTADTPFRISAFLHEAAAEGVIAKLNPHLTEKDKQALIDLLTNPEKRPQLNDITARANDAMADFSRMTPTQRKLARRLLVIPGWLVAGSRYPVHFAATHPGRSAALGYVAAGEPGAPKELQVNKPINEYFQKDLPPWVEGIGVGDKTFRTTSLSPVNTPWDIAGAVSGRKDAGTIADFANPLGGALWHVANRELSGPHGSYRTSYKKSILGNLERLAPGEKFVREEISPPKNPKTYPEDSSRLGRLKREIGVIPIKVNPDRAQTTDHTGDALALVKKLGLGSHLPPVAQKSLSRLAERDTAWKNATHGKKSGTRDYYVAKYKADLALAEKWGYLKPAQVARAQEWIGHAPVDDIRKAHSALSDEGGIFDKELAPGRETERWLKAQDAYVTDLADAVKRGVLTQSQAGRAKAWARKADNSDIDKARVALERKLLAPVG